jgi:DNA-binding response OmpR family regulator
MTASPKALLVDADASLRAMVVESLRLRAVTVDVAHDAPSASLQLARGGYCGVVLDVPDGDDILRFMNARSIELPTVVIRGSVSEFPEGDQVKMVLPRPANASLLACVLLGLCGVDK